MYKIVGIDGKVYGPITAAQLRQWITEGRANALTQVLAPGATEWQALGGLADFAGPFASPPPINPISPVSGLSRKTNAYAVVGLIFGVLSLIGCCCCGCPFSILGMIFSLIGWVQITRHPEVYEGRWLAIIGFILSALALLLGIGLTLLRLALHPGHVEWHFRTF